MSRQIRLLSILAAATILGGCPKATTTKNEGAPSVAATVPTGGVCGGITGAQCSNAGDFCKKATGQCKVADAQGTCTKKPTECTFEYKPVCGCNGKTYGNACAADAAGVSVASQGECAASGGGGGGGGVPILLKIVPDMVNGVASYCRMTNTPNGHNLIVRLQNSSPIAKAPLTVSVGFSSTPAQTVNVTSPAIPGPGTVDVPVAVPNSCFTGDCHFLIKALDPAGTVQAQGSCLG